MEIRTLADIFFRSIEHDVERHLLFKRETITPANAKNAFDGDRRAAVQK